MLDILQEANPFFLSFVLTIVIELGVAINPCHKTIGEQFIRWERMMHSTSKWQNKAIVSCDFL